MPKPTPGSSQLPDNIDLDEGSIRPVVGPSDSSDSPSDRPASDAFTDSDSQHTGKRPDVDPSVRDETGEDIEPDAVADESQVGLAHTRPDPVRNGGNPK